MNSNVFRHTYLTEKFIIYIYYVLLARHNAENETVLLGSIRYSCSLRSRLTHALTHSLAFCVRSVAASLVLLERWRESRYR